MTVPRACVAGRIVLELREDAEEFASAGKSPQILRTYSNFAVSYLSGREVVNTVEAIWASQPSDVSDDDYSEFYRYVANAFDEPRYRLHFRADVPLDLKALFFRCHKCTQKSMAWGAWNQACLCKGKYSSTAKRRLTASWLRFVRGVVDSESPAQHFEREHAGLCPRQENR